jgi:hypothetical protein
MLSGDTFSPRSPQKEQAPPSLQPESVGKRLCPVRCMAILSKGLALPLKDEILWRTEVPSTCSSQQD